MTDQRESEPDRVLRTVQEASASYDRLSRWYDAISGSSERPFRLAGLELLAARPGERVLELGPGTGHALLALAQAVGEAGRVAALDVSGGMLRRAGDRLANAGLAGRVALARGDAARLPFGDASFDGLFASFFLDLVDTPEIPACLDECRRVLRPGGRVALVSMSSEGRQGAMSRLYAWAHRRAPRLVDCRPIPVERSLRRRGFTVVTADLRSMWGMPVEIVLATR
jgi:demethylmenaquinone methyltransferase/2-methoxy-6-polyprenyl-1,4-benzoquinol methylase